MQGIQSLAMGERTSHDPGVLAFENDGRSGGGMRKMSAEEVGQGVPPNWMPYFTVDSSEQAVARVDELGGAVKVPTTEVPALKFTVVHDPQGAFFALFEGEVDD